VLLPCGPVLIHWPALNVAKIMLSAMFENPMAYVQHLQDEHLEWLRSRVSLLLVCGQGQWEDTTGALESTKRLASLLGEKGIPHELDLWGHDVPHDWPSWQAQIAHHLARFV
jgi:esterase/lipase superfamily enzyme